MPTYNIFCFIGNILSQILKLLFGLHYWQDFNNLIYQTLYTKLNLQNQIFDLGTKPILSNQISWTKFTKPCIQKCIYKMKYTKQNLKNWNKHTEPNIFNQTWKLNLPNQFYQTKLREPKYTEK